MIKRKRNRRKQTFLKPFRRMKNIHKIKLPFRNIRRFIWTDCRHCFMESTGSLRKLHRKNQGHRNCGGLFKNKILGSYVHRFSRHRNSLPTARLGLRVSERPFAQGRSFISSAISPLPLATCWFSCLAAPPIDCFTNKLAQSAQTVFVKQSLCSPIRRKSAKGLPSEAEISALWLWKVVNLCKWAVLLCWHCLLLGDSWTQLRPHIRPSVSFIKT